MDLVGTMPDFKTLFPHFGNIGKKYIKNSLKKMCLRDCILILYRLSSHYFKYCTIGYNNQNSEILYKKRCVELIDKSILDTITQKESANLREYSIIFPELSILNLLKLCFKYCNDSDYTKEENFPEDTLHTIGKLLLIENSLMVENQTKYIPKENEATIELVVNFTKQSIVDKNYNLFQKFWQNYFIFNYLKNYNNNFDIETIFMSKYGLSVYEYSAFMFLLSSQFLPQNNIEDDSMIRYLNIEIGLSSLKDKFNKGLLQNLLINNINTKKIDKSFFNVIDFTKKPLIMFNDGNIVSMSLKRLFLGLTDSVYFDILDYLPDKKTQDDFSKYFGCATEDYFKDIIKNIDENAIFDFFYYYKKDEKKTPDAILIQNDCLIFFECKKRPFHDIDFLTNGNNEMFFKRVKEFYYNPLKQLCERIEDFRNGKFSIKNINKDALIYPVIVYTNTPPIFSGAWDRFNFDQYVLNDIFRNDKNIMQPEFIDLCELESIEEYLGNNPNKNIVDLIKLKRDDKIYHNANWSIILHKYNIYNQNKRLSQKYLEISSDFKNILFENIS